MPVGAYGGKAEIMDVVSPLGGVYQAGTLSGNPISVAAGLATLSELEKEGVYEALEAKTTILVEGLLEAARMRCAGDGESGGVDVHPVLRGASHPKYGRYGRMRSQGIRTVLSRHAGAGSESSAEPV